MPPKKTPKETAVADGANRQGHPEEHYESLPNVALDDNTARMPSLMMSTQGFNAEHFVVTFMQSFAQSQAEVNRSLIESLRATTLADSRSSATATPASSASEPAAAAAPSGNFSRCTARFDGQARDPEVLEAFLDAVETYKECTAVSDEHAVKGLSMLLEGEAAVWWRGVKRSVVTWRDAAERLRAMYGAPRPGYELLREMFAIEHQEERAEAFICRLRALIVRLPYAVPEAMQVDIIYGQLHRRIRKRLLRDDIVSVDCLLDKARVAEDAICQVKMSVPKVLPTSASGAAGDSSENRSIYSADGIEGPIPRANISNSNISNDSSEISNSRSKRNRASNLRSKTDAAVTDNTVGTSFGNNGVNEPIRCYWCGKPGVIRSKCDNCSTSIRADFNYSDDTYCGEVSPHPVVAVGILGRQGVAIADTGATHCIASPALYDILIAGNVSFQRTRRTLRLADGSQQFREVLTADVPVTVEGRSFVANFMVIPGGKTKTLLGFDFLSKAGIVPDGSRDSWSFADEPDRCFAFVRKYHLSNAENSEPMQAEILGLSLCEDKGAAAARTFDEVRDNDLEADDALFRGSQWTDRGYVLSDHLLFRCSSGDGGHHDACHVGPEHERAQARQKEYADRGRRRAPGYDPGALVSLNTQGRSDTAVGQTPGLVLQGEGLRQIRDKVTWDRASVGFVSGEDNTISPVVGDVQPPVRKKRKRRRTRRYLDDLSNVVM